ncbi:hypothetical protein PV328_009546 [Microctonus aethiopoides]|uniref:Gustatory receptor n=1 Tax=Microctonus aethiopoides TaxID=144406 RepID=A0AA39C605_9HYME|nr:hypothetical protein PV328_009546 [Microctonus aethiopoides]
MKNNYQISPILFYYWKILGICPFVLDDSQIIKRSISGILYTLLLIASYTYCYTRVFASQISNFLSHLTLMVVILDGIGIGLEYCVVIVIWIYSLIHQNKLRYILNNFKNNTNNAIALGMKKIPTCIIRQMQICLLLQNLYTIIITTFSYWTLWYYEMSKFDLATTISFNIPRPISLNLITIYIFSLKIIKEQFIFINESIRRLPNYTNDRNTLKRYRKQRLNVREINDWLKKYDQLHTDLCDFVLTLTKFLALPILITLAFQFAQSIVNIYLTVIFINEHHDNLARKIASITMVLGWLLIRMINILFILDVCDSTCAEANHIANVSHETWASGALNGFKEEVNNSSNTWPKIIIQFILINLNE